MSVYRYTGDRGVVRVWHWEVWLNELVVYDSDDSIDRAVIDRMKDHMYRLTRRERRGEYRNLPRASCRPVGEYPSVSPLPRQLKEYP
jgi:hypothetical protein